MQYGFPCPSCFLCSSLLQWSCFLASICPPGPWTAAQCVSWWLQDSEESLLEKKEGGVSEAVGPLQTHRVSPCTPTVLQHSKEKSVFPLVFLLFSLWWKECRCKVAFVVRLSARRPFLLLQSRLFIRWPTFAVGLILFTSDMCYWPKRGVELNLLIYQCMPTPPGIDSSLNVSPQRNLCRGEAATSHLTLWLYVTGVSCRAEIVTVWQADSRGLESKDLAGSLCFCGCGMCMKWFEWSIEKVVAWGILLFLFDYWFFWERGGGFPHLCSWLVSCDKTTVGSSMA